MNYEPNLVNWKVGDLVIHDADAKEEEMLMRIIKIQGNGLYITEYIHPLALGGMKSKWKNEKKYLLNPKLFGIKKRK